jgi:glutamyl-tRNA synthetase
VLGRYAPSPTGLMHRGNARTALMAWLQARRCGGAIALRVDDLDRTRCRPQFTAALRDDLAWLGLAFDAEAPAQSTRTDAYAAAVDALAARGLVYPCYCTRSEVRASASAPHTTGTPATRYPGTCRELSPAAARARAGGDRPATLRLRVEPGRIEWVDQVLGRRSQDVARSVGDFVLRRGDGVHAYQLAVVVDDAAIGVTHVLRGDDLADSTPRQILLQRLLRLDTPRYAHVPLLYALSGERLAKRHHAATIAALRAAGANRHSVVGSLASSIGLCRPGEQLDPYDLIDRCGSIGPVWAS